MPCAVVGCSYMAFAAQYDQVLPPRAASPAKSTQEDGNAPAKKVEIELPRVLFCLSAVTGMVLLAAADLVHIDVGVLIVSLLLTGTGCITVEEAMSSMCVPCAPLLTPSDSTVPFHSVSVNVCAETVV